MKAWAASLAVAVLGGGCFFSYGAAVGPTVDTHGDIGLQLSLRGSYGLTIDDENAVAENIRVDVAPPGLVTPSVTPIVGFDYFHLFSDAEVALRVGVRGRFQLTWGDTFQAWIGGGGSFAVLPELDNDDNDSDEHTLLGVELEGYYTDDSAADVPEGGEPPHLGIFGASLVWEQVILDDDWFDDTWD